MGISHKYGRDDPDQYFFFTKRPVYAFLSRIVGELGAIHCIQPTDCKLSDLEEKRKFRNENVKQEKCAPLLRKVVEAFLYVVEDWQSP
jgi:hypothetical protein